MLWSGLWCVYGGDDRGVACRNHPSSPLPSPPPASGTFSPDIFFALANLRGDSDEQVFYASFFTGGGLGMLLCTGCAKGNTWSNPNNIVQASGEMGV